MSASSLELQKFLDKHEAGSSILEIIDDAISKAQSGDITIHPYGFYILKPKEENEKQIRVHVWLSGIRARQDPDWPPHNHNFDLDSIVIKGELCHNIWSVKQTSPSNSTLYEVSYDSKLSKLTKTNHISSCDLTSTDLHNQGGSYHLPKYAYHSVDVNLNNCAATLCVMANPGNDSQYVVGDIQGKSSYEFSRRNVLSKECGLVLQILFDIRDAIRVV